MRLLCIVIITSHCHYNNKEIQLHTYGTAQLKLDTHSRLLTSVHRFIQVPDQ